MHSSLREAKPHSAHTIGAELFYSSLIPVYFEVPLKISLFNIAVQITLKDKACQYIAQ